MMDISKSEEQIKKELLDELKKEYPIETDVTFNEFNIQEKLKSHAFILMQYQKHHDKAKYEYDKMLELKDKIVGEQYHYYRFNYDENLTKPEIERYYLPRDQKITKMNKLLRIQDIKVKFFEISMKAIDKMGWNMKSFIEAHKSL